MIDIYNLRIFPAWIIISISSSIYTSSTESRRNGFVDGHIIIGAMFPIHEQPTIEGSYSRKCGEIREEYGMQRVEVLLKTLEEINNNTDILPGIKLGVDIRDSCWYAPIALEQSIDFIKNSIQNYKLMDIYIDAMRNNIANSEKSIASLIGPASSEVSIQVQNLLQLFKIPQVGYSATSIDLSRKDEYKYFLRVVPSDKLQIKVIIALITHFKWNYISLLNTMGNYGTRGIKYLIESLKENKEICTDEVQEIDNKAESEKYEETVQKLFANKKAKVLICYCLGDTVTKLLRAMIKLNMTKQGYLIIGTDGWADRTDILGELIDKYSQRRDLSLAAVGSLSIRLQSKPLENFDQYFRSKSFKSTDGNPWFQEFWEHKFKCHINNTRKNRYNKSCSGKESLFDKDYKQDSKLGFVVKSLMTVALGLHNLYQKLCKSNITGCNEFLNVNGTLLLNEMLNLSFRAYDNETVSFDTRGDPPGRYEIMNYQDGLNDAGVKIFQYQKVGIWYNDNLIIDKEVRWPENENSNDTQVKSICSPDCSVGQFRAINTLKTCCWTCHNCSEKEIVSTNHSTCIICSDGKVPSHNRTVCQELPLLFIQWTEIPSLIAIVFSCVGIIATFIITIIFAKFNNTPVVKSSTRELMYVILVGITLSYLTTFPLLHKPSVISCTLTRIMPGLSFSLIYGSLVTKTNRICRILAISKKKIIRRKGRFLTTTSQLVIVFIINVVELIIIILILWQEPAKAIKNFETWGKAFLLCNTSVNSLCLPLGFDALLVCFCTWYAFKTRNLPENFNEAKFIGFTMYTTCIIWIGLVPVYYGDQSKVISLCFAINLSATVAIVLLFMPKVYIILFRPEKNERAAFTTTTEIRCHIGSGKVEYQCFKEKNSTKSNSQHLKCPNEESQIMMKKPDQIDFNGDFNSSNNKTFPQHLEYDDTKKEAKLTQTDFSLMMDFLFSLSNSLGINNDDLNITQIALLQFLEENWNRENILHFGKINSSENPKPSILCVEEIFEDDEQFSENDLEYADTENNSLKQQIFTQCNSVLTCSPISNVSTDASSTITTLFLDYLHMHGKKFKNQNDKKSVKL